jgi:hypothetical protein
MMADSTANCEYHGHIKLSSVGMWLMGAELNPRFKLSVHVCATWIDVAPSPIMLSPIVPKLAFLGAIESIRSAIL